MLLQDAISRLKVDLSMLDETLMSDAMMKDVLARAVERATSDLSRFLPREMEYEITLAFDVANEAWTAAASAGTYVSLANKPIKYNSETVKDATAAVCTRDTDYYMDYTAGKITHISGGKISNNEVCTISYSKSSITFDLSSLTDLMRVDRVEYPLGQIPQSFVPAILRGNLLTITGGSGDRSGQVALTSGNHIVVYYKARHTPPTQNAAGSFASFLDDTVILAASAYALFTLVMNNVSQAEVDIVNAETIITTIDWAGWEGPTSPLALGAAQLSKAATALDKVISHLEGVTNTASAYLSTAEPLINKVNEGDRVPENYAAIASQAIGIANAFIAEATERNNTGSQYQNEASIQVAKADRLLAECARYLEAATQNLTQAEKYRAEGVERRNEAWAIWKDPKQYIGSYVMNQLRQPTESS